METGPFSPTQEYLPENPCIAVVLNPASTGAKRAHEQVLEIVRSESYVPGSIYETVPGGLEANREGLLRLLSKGAGKNEDGSTKRYDAILVLGGDGSGDMVVNFLAGQPGLPEDIRDTVIIDGRNGGANDGHRARFHKGGLNLKKLGGLPIANLYPVRVETTLPSGETRTHWTTLYQTLGFSALTAEGLNGPRHRNSWLRSIPGGRKLREYMVGLKALFNSEDFVIEENGQERTVHELIISNNSRMGGFELFPGDATKDSFHTAEAQSKTKLLGLATKLLLKKAVWQERKDLEFTVGVRGPGRHRAVPSQHSGETERLTRGTRIKASKDTRPLRHATTRLAA